MISIARRRKIYRILILIVLGGLVFEIILWNPLKIGIVKKSAEKSDLIKPVEINEGTEQVMEGVQLVRMKGSVKEWELRASKAYSLRETGQLILEEVKVRVFGDQDVQYIITGKKGEVLIDKKDILVTGNVITETSNGYRMSTDQVLYQSQARTLECPTEVKLYTFKKGSEGALELTGMGMLTDLTKNEISILSDVYAEKILKDGDKFKLKSNNAIFKGTDNSALFNGNIVMDMKSSRVTGDRAVLDVDPQTRSASSATILGNVKLTDVQRWAVASEAQLLFPERKFILRGAPKLIQNNDEIRGEEIVFLNEGKDIQIKKARAKIEKANQRKVQ